MKNRIALLGMILGFGVLLCQVAQVSAEPGGVPAIATRVTILENTMTTQQTATANLDDDVATLKLQVAELQDLVATLRSQRPMFAVVDRDGTLRAQSSFGVQKVERATDDHGNPLTGHFDVFFNRDVSKCAITVTAEPGYSAGLIASINGTFRGTTFPFPLNMVSVVLSEGLNDRIDTRFSIIVVC